MSLSNRTRNLIAAVALAVAGLAMAWQQWSAFDRERRLDAGGVTAPGTIIDIRMDKYESVARVTYVPSGQSSRTLEIGVSRTFADAIYRGHAARAVTVRYLPHDEEVADIAGASQASGGSLLFTAGLFGLAAWAMRLGLRDETQSPA